jgi:hypothetical protein
MKGAGEVGTAPEASGGKLMSKLEENGEGGLEENGEGEMGRWVGTRRRAGETSGETGP